MTYYTEQGFAIAVCDVKDKTFASSCEKGYNEYMYITKNKKVSTMIHFFNSLSLFQIMLFHRNILKWKGANQLKS